MNRIQRLGREIECIRNADDIILNYPEHKAEDNRVNLHYYHAEWCDRETDVNLGDYLSEVIVRWLCEKNGILFEKKIPERKHLYAIGSILQMGYQNATVWGTGFAFELGKLRAFPHRRRNLDIKCVRGPLTRNTLIQLGFNCPEIYGDPGVLMPMIYRPREAAHMDYVIIPHYSVEDKTRSEYGTDRIISMNTKDYASVIDRICASDKVISSSLHGIILAEAYGIPAVFYQDREQRFNYKYEDWYQSTGRSLNHICMSVEEAIKLESSVPSEVIERLQNNLLLSFPIELWQ